MIRAELHALNFCFLAKTAHLWILRLNMKHNGVCFTQENKQDSSIDVCCVSLAWETGGRRTYTEDGDRGGGFGGKELGEREETRLFFPCCSVSI